MQLGNTCFCFFIDLLAGEPGVARFDKKLMIPFLYRFSSFLFSPLLFPSPLPGSLPAPQSVHATPVAFVAYSLIYVDDLGQRRLAHDHLQVIFPLPPNFSTLGLEV